MTSEEDTKEEGSGAGVTRSLAALTSPPRRSAG